MIQRQCIGRKYRSRDCLDRNHFNYSKIEYICQEGEPVDGTDFSIILNTTVKLKPEKIELSDLRRSLSYSHLPCIVDSSTACMYCFKCIYNWNCLGDKTRNITEKVSLTISICCMQTVRKLIRAYLMSHIIWPIFKIQTKDTLAKDVVTAIETV